MTFTVLDVMSVGWLQNGVTTEKAQLKIGIRKTRRGNTLRTQQGVAGYDPQVPAMLWLMPGAIVYRMARGSSPEP